MENLVSLILYFVGGITVAVGAGWFYTRAKSRYQERLNPVEGAILTIRATSGVYRSHMITLGRTSWTLSAPLQRDNYVPLRVGEELIIEAATDRGALLFRSEVVARMSNPHAILIKRPTKIHRVERREHKRWPNMAGERVRVEGQVGQLLDLSEGGARVRLATKPYKGDRVRLDMPSGKAVYAWVIASEGSEARLRFEELMNPNTETAPAV